MIKVIDEMDLAGTSQGKISVGVLKEPYGVDSQSVVSIAISLNGELDSVDWKVHIPKANIDAVIAALRSAKEVM